MSLRPIRIYYDLGPASNATDCTTTSQFIQVGQPDVNTAPLLLCSSDSPVLNPFSPPGLSTDCWLRCREEDIVTEGTRDWFKENIVQPVKGRLEGFLNILWPEDSVQVPAARDVEPGSAEDVSACQQISLPLSQVAPSGSFSTEVPYGGDIRIFVTLRPSTTTGTTSVCHQDGYGRPVVAHINVRAADVLQAYQVASSRTGGTASPRTASVAADQMQYLTNALLHETLHALAFTRSAFWQFRTPQRRLWPRVLLAAEVRGAELQYLGTPAARYAARQAFRGKARGSGPRQSIPGIEMVLPPDDPEQDVAAPGSQELHISAQMARGDIMNDLYSAWSVVSNFTLAVLADTGWYWPDFTVGVQLPWSSGLPASLLLAEPRVNESTLEPYNCLAAPPPGQHQVSCSYEPTLKGFCTEPSEDAGLPQELKSAYVSPRRELGSCTAGALSPYFNGSRLVPEVFGDASRCFQLRQSGSDALDAREAVCLPHRCVNGTSQVQLAGSWRQCPFSALASFSISQAWGTADYEVQCPDRLAACPDSTPPAPCPLDCNNHGNCNETAGCECTEAAWSGPACSDFTCRVAAGDVGEPGGGGEDGGVSPDAPLASTSVTGPWGSVCACPPDTTGVECALPTPRCPQDCSSLGYGFLCYQDACEEQCSINGRTCRDASSGAVQAALPAPCRDAFARLGTRHLCLPDGDDASVALSGINNSYQRELESLQLTGAQSTPTCTLATTILACYTVFRECDPEGDVELPLCSNTCEAYEKGCGAPSPCSAARLAPASTPSSRCSGTNNPADFLPPSQIAIIAAVSTLAVLLVALLAAYCCARRAGQPFGVWLRATCCGVCGPLQYTPASSPRSPSGGRSAARRNPRAPPSLHGSAASASGAWQANPLCCLLSPRRPLQLGAPQSRSTEPLLHTALTAGSLPRASRSGMGQALSVSADGSTAALGRTQSTRSHTDTWARAASGPPGPRNSGSIMSLAGAPSDPGRQDTGPPPTAAGPSGAGTPSERSSTAALGAPLGGPPPGRPGAAPSLFTTMKPSAFNNDADDGELTDLQQSWVADQRADGVGLAEDQRPLRRRSWPSSTRSESGSSRAKPSLSPANSQATRLGSSQHTSRKLSGMEGTRVSGPPGPKRSGDSSGEAGQRTSTHASTSQPSASLQELRQGSMASSGTVSTGRSAGVRLVKIRRKRRLRATASGDPPPPTAPADFTLVTAGSGLVAPRRSASPVPPRSPLAHVATSGEQVGPPPGIFVTSSGAASPMSSHPTAFTDQVSSSAGLGSPQRSGSEITGGVSGPHDLPRVPSGYGGYRPELTPLHEGIEPPTTSLGPARGSLPAPAAVEGVGSYARVPEQQVLKVLSLPGATGLPPRGWGSTGTSGLQPTGRGTAFWRPAGDAASPGTGDGGSTVPHAHAHAWAQPAGDPPAATAGHAQSGRGVADPFLDSSSGSAGSDGSGTTSDGDSGGGGPEGGGAQGAFVKEGGGLPVGGGAGGSRRAPPGRPGVQHVASFAGSVTLKLPSRSASRGPTTPGFGAHGASSSPRRSAWIGASSELAEGVDGSQLERTPSDPFLGNSSEIDDVASVGSAVRPVGSYEGPGAYGARPADYREEVWPEEGLPVWAEGADPQRPGAWGGSGVGGGSSPQSISPKQADESEGSDPFLEA